MKWWDDLWLNESFADFISHFCLEKIKPNITTLKYDSSFASFTNRKGWGYAEDQMVTTHPIAGDVANTQVAESIFDGITYSKGAATINSHGKTLFWRISLVLCNTSSKVISSQWMNGRRCGLKRPALIKLSLSGTITVVKKMLSS
jgi:hypothetical protein